MPPPPTPPRIPTPIPPPTPGSGGQGANSQPTPQQSSWLDSIANQLKQSATQMGGALKYLYDTTKGYADQLKSVTGSVLTGIRDKVSSLLSPSGNPGGAGSSKPTMTPEQERDTLLGQTQAKIDQITKRQADMKDVDARRTAGLTSDQYGNPIKLFITSVEKYTQEIEKSDLAQKLKDLAKELDEVNSKYEQQKKEQEKKDEAKTEFGSKAAQVIGGQGGTQALGGVRSLASGEAAAGGIAGKANAYLAIAEGAAQMVRDTLTGFNNAMKATGEVAIRLAGNDGFGALTAAGEGAAKGLEKIPVVGGIAADSIRTFTSALNIGKSVIDSFAERGRELSRYNGAIAGAAAQARVEKILADIDEANKNQDLYVKMIQAQSQIDREWQRAIVELKVLLAPVLVQMAKNLTSVVKVITAQFKFYQSTEDKAETRLRAAALMGVISQQTLEEQLKIIDEIRKNVDKTTKPEMMTPMLVNLGRTSVKINEGPAEKQRGQVKMPSIFD
jgi:hypothetical protein